MVARTRTRLPLPGRGAAYVFDAYGPEDGVPMVLLHELGGSAKRWQEVVPQFAAGHRVHAFDLRGHGDSDWASEYSHRLIADDIIVAMDALEISGAVVVGHSTGGNVALLVAMHRPDLVSRLVIEDVVPPAPRARRLPRPGPAARPMPHDWECIASLLVEATTYDAWMWEQLELLPMPTLIVAGGGNSHIPPADLEKVAHRIPDAELVRFDVGHFVHRNRPQEFADAVLSWLASRALDATLSASRVGSPSLRTPPAIASRLCSDSVPAAARAAR
ncbi:alpha/beta hydrolase [Nocardioides sp. CCNWLW239]|uniref:alpha/beta fold hydrolase n=1 Tax=Nocardioides sp. CCNWLW239 TaxID=3128902 RepID=UPI0030190F13